MPNDLVHVIQVHGVLTLLFLHITETCLHENWMLHCKEGDSGCLPGGCQQIET